MASVKRLVQWVSVLLVVIFLSIILADHRVTRSTAKHAYHVLQQEPLAANGKSIDALIVGGSNAMFGLSARQLSQQLNLRFHNLALELEGRSQTAYSEYLQGLAQSPLEANKIRLVIYSSVSSLRKGTIDTYQNSNQDLFGQVPFSIKPRTDVRRLLKQIKSTLGTDTRLLPDAFGDLDFSSEPCRLPLTDVDVETEDLDEVLPFVQERVGFLKGLFPNAKIVVVVPSEFYAGGELPAQWKLDFLQGMSDLKLENTQFLIQQPLPKAEWVCEVRHHPNAAGRAWRTSDLLAAMHGMGFTVLAGR